MNSNGIKYSTNHFFVEVARIPAGEFIVDYTTEEITVFNYKTKMAPYINYLDLSTKTSDGVKIVLEMSAIPQNRFGVEEILKNWGLEHWDAFDQFYVTRGRCDGDPQKIKFVGEDISLEEVLSIRRQYLS